MNRWVSTAQAPRSSSAISGRRTPRSRRSSGPASSRDVHPPLCRCVPRRGARQAGGRRPRSTGTRSPRTSADRPSSTTSTPTRWMRDTTGRARCWCSATPSPPITSAQRDTADSPAGCSCRSGREGPEHLRLPPRQSRGMIRGASPTSACATAWSRIAGAAGPSTISTVPNGRSTTPPNTIRAAGVPPVVLAGKEYGTGSSRTGRPKGRRYSASGR